MKRYRVSIVFNGAALRFFIDTIEAGSKEEAKALGVEKANKKHKGKLISSVLVTELK